VPATAGTAEPRERIVGGGVADAGEWRFAASLRQRPAGFVCGAAIVAPDLAITAGHCVHKVKTRRLLLRAGTPWVRGGPRGEKLPVADVEIHPGYKHSKVFRDVALLRLERPASVPPVALPTAEEGRAATRPGRVVEVAGWGARSPFGTRVARRLKSTEEEVRRARLCRKSFGKRGFLPDSMICTLGETERRLSRNFKIRASSCFGDSGGPLVARTPTGPLLVGVVSVGSFPCGYAAPSIYTRVTSEIPFIRDALEQSAASP
jgi:secreted trypsin-like serine protease